MKLEDFEAVARLKADREYFETLKRQASKPMAFRKVKLGDHDMCPELIEKLMPELGCLLDNEIKRTDEALAKLGVVV